MVCDGELTADPPLGAHVRRAGEECAPRTAVLPAGVLLRPAALGLAAALGHDVLPVRPRPRVSALVTGDELLDAGLPGEGKIRDAVSPLLPGAVAAAGGDLVAARRVGDRLDALVSAVASAPGELVLTSGASSHGPADHLAPALSALGATVLVDGVAVRPGGPAVLARLPDGRLLAGLPGNPLAALAAFVTVVVPALAGLAGRPLPALARARLTERVPCGRVPRLLPVRLAGDLAHPTGHGGSAMLRGAAVADALALVDREAPAGTQVRTVPLP